MKWFKHFSQAKMDTKLVMIRSEFGMWGIGVYWTLVEFAAEQMKGVDPKPEATLSMRELCSFLGCKRNKLETFLKRLQNIRGMSYTLKRDILTIDCPKLLQIKDNYHKDLEETPKQLPSKEGEGEVDVEVDKETATDTAATKEGEGYKEPPAEKVLLDQYLLQEWGREGRLSASNMTRLLALKTEFGDERLRFAIAEAARYNKHSVAYVEGILGKKKGRNDGAILAEKTEKLLEERKRRREALK